MPPKALSNTWSNLSPRLAYINEFNNPFLCENVIISAGSMETDVCSIGTMWAVAS